MNCFLNCIKMIGTKKDLIKFIKSCKTHDNLSYSFSSIFPYPQGLLEKEDEYINEWSLYNWGSTDVLDQAACYFNKYLEENENDENNDVSELYFELESEKEYCVPWLKYASNMYPNIEFSLNLENIISNKYHTLYINNGEISKVNHYNSYSKYVYNNYIGNNILIKDLVKIFVDKFFHLFIVEDNIFNLFNFEVFAFEDFIWATTMTKDLGIIIKENIDRKIKEHNIKEVI